MRRMKPVPLETYPITEYQNVGDGIDLIIKGPLYDKLRDSPHALTLRMYAQCAGVADYAGVVEIKMIPGKVIGTNEEKYSYFGSVNIGNKIAALVYGYILKDPNTHMGNLTLTWDEQPDTMVGMFDNTFNYYKDLGYTLGDLINLSIESVSDSYLTISSIV